MRASAHSGMHTRCCAPVGAVWIFELAVDVFFGLDLIVNFCTGIIDDKGAEVSRCPQLPQSAQDQ